MPGAAGGPAEVKPRAEARRAQVLAAATKLFRERGFHGTSMHELAKAAEMSVGHIYHYFENKEAIIEAIGSRDLEEFMQLLEAISGHADPIQALVDSVADGVSKVTDPSAAILHVEVLAESSRNPTLTAATERTDRLVRERLRAVLANARPAGVPPNDAHLDTRIDLMNGLFEGVMCRSVHGQSLDRAVVTPLLQAALRAVLEGTVPTAPES